MVKKHGGKTIDLPTNVTRPSNVVTLHDNGKELEKWRKLMHRSLRCPIFKKDLDMDIYMDNVFGDELSNFKTACYMIPVILNAEIATSIRNSSNICDTPENHLKP